MEMKVGSTQILSVGGQIEIKQEGMKWTDGSGESRGNRYIGPFSPQKARKLAYHLLLAAETSSPV